MGKAVLAPAPSVARPRVLGRESMSFGALGFGLLDHRENGVTFGLWAGPAWDGKAMFSGHIERGMAGQCRTLAEAFDFVDWWGDGHDQGSFAFCHAEVLIEGASFAIRSLFGPVVRPVWYRGPVVRGMGTDLRRIAGRLDAVEAQAFGGGDAA